MTVVAVWFEPHDNRVWVIADTRISGLSGAGTLTDGGAKVLPLTLRCHEPAASGFFDRVTAATTLGFAYAGSTLPALMTYAVVSTCLQGLAGAPGTPPPSISDVAVMAARVAQRYVVETMADFEAVIAGWCPRQVRFRAMVIEADPGVVPRRMRVREAPLYDDEHVTLLGSHRQEMEDAIRAAFARTAGQSLRRAPMLALSQIVREDRLPSVGGSLQIGTASHLGFELKWRGQPIRPGTHEMGRFLLGIDLDVEIGLVGGYHVGMVGTL